MISVGQKVLYHSAVNQHSVLEAEVTQVNPDGTVDVIFPDRPGQAKLSIPVAESFPEIEIRGQKLLRSYVEVPRL